MCLIRVQLVGPATARPASGTHRRDAVDQRDEHRRVVRVRGPDADDERQRTVLGQHVQLERRACRDRSGLARSAPSFARPHARAIQDRVRPVQLPARPELVEHGDVDAPPQPARRVHCPNRRCAVVQFIPDEPGRSGHAHLLVSTYTIAVNTARGSVGAVPPPCARAVNGGTNGSAIATTHPEPDARKEHHPRPLSMPQIRTPRRETFSKPVSGAALPPGNGGCQSQRKNGGERMSTPRRSRHPFRRASPCHWQPTRPRAATPVRVGGSCCVCWMNR